MSGPKVSLRVLSFKGTVLPLEVVYVAQQTQFVLKPTSLCAWKGQNLIMRSLRIGPFEQLVGVEGGGGLALSLWEPYAVAAPALTMPVCEVGETVTLGLYNPSGAVVVFDVDLVGQSVG